MVAHHASVQSSGCVLTLHSTNCADRIEVEIRAGHVVRMRTICQCHGESSALVPCMEHSLPLLMACSLLVEAVSMAMECQCGSKKAGNL